MAQPNKIKRPLLTERYDTLLNILKMNDWIEILEVAYQETHNEKVYRVLEDLKQTKKMFWDVEDEYRKDEIRELLENINFWPHSVRTWATAYRDDEIS